MTHSPAAQAIAASRSRNCAVGRPATVERNFFPRRPRPMVSRPVDLASAKLRFSMASATHPRACAAWIRVVMASLTRASRVGPGRPATTSGTVSGDPTGFPDGSTTHAARCPSFRSTPRTGPDVASCTSVGTCSGLGTAHDACRYQRPRPGSNEIRYVTQRLAATRSAHTCCRWWNTTGTARLRRAPSFPTSAPGTLTLRCPAWSTRMVSFPNRFPDSPSALRNIRWCAQRHSHAWTLRCACARLFRVRQSHLPPGTTLGRPDASVVSTTPRRDVSWARRRVLPCHSPWLRYPAILPTRPPPGAALRCATLPVAAASMARSAASARTARSYWSWVARVIEPAHRDDDRAVRYFLRTLRDCARPWASSFPWLSRVTRSARYNDPRNVPTSRSACSSAGVGRRRVLIVTPDGGETTNDSASTRSMGYTLSPGTDNARNNNTRAHTRAWPTKALYCSLKCTRLATVCSPLVPGHRVH